MNKKLIITMEITDPETVAEYMQVHPEIIMEDIRDGTLARLAHSCKVEVADV